MQRVTPSLLLRYGVAIVSIVVATLLRLLLNPVLGTNLPFPTYFMAVIFTAWYARLGPALLAIGLGGLLAAYFFVAPQNSLAITELAGLLGLGIYFFAGITIALLSEKMHRARERVEETAAALHEQREWLRVTLASIGDAVIVTDAQSRVSFINPVAEQLTGWKQEEANGKPLKDAFNIISEETRQSVEDPTARVLREGIVVGLANHTILITKDGREIPIDDSLAPIRNEKGNIIGLVLVLRDISDRKRVDQEMKESEERYRIVAETASDAIITIDQTSTILFVNRAIEKIFGYTPEEVLGQNLTMLMPDYLRHIHRAGIRRYIETDQRHICWEGVELPGLHKSGREVPLEISFGEFIKDGKHIFTGIVRDITDRKRAEAERALLVAEVEHQRRRVEELLRNVPGVVWEAWGQPDHAGQRINFVSQHVEAMLGYSIEEWLSTPNFWLTIVHPDDKERAAKEAAAIFASRKGGISEFRWMSKDGRVVWVESQSVVICDEEGKAIGMRGVTMDISERKRAERSHQFLAEASALLASSLDYEATLASLARLAVPELADWCSIQIVEEGGEIRQLAVAHVDPSKKRWADELQHWYPPDPNESAGVPHVLRTGKSEFYAEIPDSLLVSVARNDEHLEILRKLRLKSAMIVPLIARDRTLGAIALAAAESRRSYTQADLALAEDLAGRAALAVDNARLFRKAQEARQRFSFVAEASASLATSLDYSTTLESIVRLAVPYFADWCTVDVLEEDGRINRLAVAARDTAKEKLLKELSERYPPTWNSPQLAARALRAGKTVTSDESSEGIQTPDKYEVGYQNMVKELGPGSQIAVPLIARGYTLGAITFTLSEENHRYAPDDVALAEDLTRRAAAAVDNAQLYREAQAAIRAREEALRLRDDLLVREQITRADAEAANRAKDEFLATVSHELRTPLNAILGWSHMMRTRELDEATHARALETIERNARSQAQLVEDILDVSRIVTGKLRLNVQPVHLISVINAAIDAVRPAADAKAVRLQTVLDPKAGPISGDPDRLQQVVWNLLSNAVKFTPKDGRIHVRLERIDSHAEITVSDTGEGISQEFLPHVFDRFRQADSTSTRQHGGLGLGLAIVRHLVEMHGGTVHAESLGEGKGASFIVRLPLMAVHAEPEFIERRRAGAAGPTSLEFGSMLKGLRVLVVDDDLDTREMLLLVLTQSGAEVRECATAREALEELKRWKPHVLISDIEMPGEDGYELIHKVRALKPEQGGSVPAVALTAYARIEDRMRALSAGYQMHMPKPADPGELIVVIASLSKRMKDEG